MIERMLKACLSLTNHHLIFHQLLRWYSQITHPRSLWKLENVISKDLILIYWDFSNHLWQLQTYLKIVSLLIFCLTLYLLVRKIAFCAIKLPNCFENKRCYDLYLINLLDKKQSKEQSLLHFLGQLDLRNHLLIPCKSLNNLNHSSIHFLKLC